MTMNRGRLLLLALVLPAAGWAGDFDSAARGTAAAKFLRLGVGARAIGLGEAYTALADEASAVYWNPAALTRIEKRSATFMHTAYLGSSYFDFAAYGQRVGERSGFGIGLQRFTAGEIAETDQSGTDVGSFNPTDLAVTLGAAHVLDGFSLGGNVKYVQSEIIDTARTVAVDLGALSPGLLEDRLRLALAVSNLGGTMKFESESEDLPLTVRAGGAYKIRKNWAVTLDAAAPRDSRIYAAAGTEYLLAVSEAVELAGRLGFNTRTIGDVSGINGLSLGLGFNFKAFSVDYALLPVGSLGQAHYLSLSAKF